MHNLENMDHHWGLGSERLSEAAINQRDDEQQQQQFPDNSTTTTSSSSVAMADTERAAAFQLQQYLQANRFSGGGGGGGDASFLNRPSQQRIEDMIIASQMGGGGFQNSNSSAASAGGMPQQPPSFNQYSNESLLSGYGYPTQSSAAASLPLSMLRRQHQNAASLLNDSNHMSHNHNMSQLLAHQAGDMNNMGNSSNQMQTNHNHNSMHNNMLLGATQSPHQSFMTNAEDIMAMNSSASHDMGSLLRPIDNSPFFESAAAQSNVAQRFHNQQAAMQSLHQSNRLNAQFQNNQDIGLQSLLAGAGQNNGNNIFENAASLFDSAAALGAQVEQNTNNLGGMPSYMQNGRLNKEDLVAMNTAALQNNHHNSLLGGLANNTDNASKLAANITPGGNALLPSAQVLSQQDQAGGGAGSGNSTSILLIPSAHVLLDPVHYFLQNECIQVFVTTEEDMTAQGRGARPSKVGQVGLRCFFCKDVPKKNLAKQAVCFPSKRANIFESVRNFQRTHVIACQCIPEHMKMKYKTLNEQGGLQKRSQKYMKAYYAEAAIELGIVDSPNGLMFGNAPNKSGIPSKGLQALIQAAENPSLSSSYWKAYQSGQGRKDKAMELRKFEHIASEETKRVISEARKEPTPFVRPEDFPTISDFEFLLFHQVSPCAPPSVALKRKGIEAEQVVKLSGFCCKHCDRARVWKNDHKGHFPVDVNTLADTSFLQKMLNHFLKCPHVPQDIKDAFDELKRLALEQDTTAKRGPRKRFIEKIWERMKSYYGLDSSTS